MNGELDLLGGVDKRKKQVKSSGSPWKPIATIPQHRPIVVGWHEIVHMGALWHQVSVTDGNIPGEATHWIEKASATHFGPLG